MWAAAGNVGSVMTAGGADQRPVAMAGPPRSAAAPAVPAPDRPDDGPAGDSPL
jgi:hypothetical protein